MSPEKYLYNVSIVAPFLLTSFYGWDPLTEVWLSKEGKYNESYRSGFWFRYAGLRA